MGQKGRPRGSYDGARKEDNMLRKYWRLRQRKYRAKKSGDTDRFSEADKRLRELKRLVTG